MGPDLWSPTERTVIIRMGNEAEVLNPYVATHATQACLHSHLLVTRTWEPGEEETARVPAVTQSVNMVPCNKIGSVSAVPLCRCAILAKLLNLPMLVPRLKNVLLGRLNDITHPKDLGQCLQCSIKGSLLYHTPPPRYVSGRGQYLPLYPRKVT